MAETRIIRETTTVIITEERAEPTGPTRDEVIEGLVNRYSASSDSGRTMRNYLKVCGIPTDKYEK